MPIPHFTSTSAGAEVVSPVAAWPRGDTRGAHRGLLRTPGLYVGESCAVRVRPKSRARWAVPGFVSCVTEAPCCIASQVRSQELLPTWYIQHRATRKASGGGCVRCFSSWQSCVLVRGRREAGLDAGGGRRCPMRQINRKKLKKKKKKKETGEKNFYRESNPG
jgi:hypothetical protein